MMAKRMMAFLVALALILGPMQLTAMPPSPAPSTALASSPELISLTEAELSAILAQAMDEAVAPERRARLAAEAKLRAWEKALPWAIADGGHLGPTGKMKVAKSYWSLLANIAADLVEEVLTEEAPIRREPMRRPSIDIPKELFTGAVPVITSDHEYIHNGQAFRIVGKTASIAAGASYNLTLSIPAATGGRYIHMRPARFATSANLMEISITEDETATGGSAVVPVNQHRGATQPSASVTAASGTTCTPAGTVTDLVVIGAGGNAVSRGGGSAGEGNEQVLRPGIKYNIAFNNIGSTTATVGYFDLLFYEEASGA